ncbi:T5orf172 domain-containing protein [Breznakibacter xylanolyticus]|uniref:T5orf172 domain-containing protein n=1 Tax=Breznakibacter xylanolyticus TaxID=990 RepID=A0A2W7NU45_9BACT|nr:GIY-YIG nuclease family protein [Breznakibacter xylanolyticus]PZX20124.1 T5orf172 domain-containing protein [Breznakibacter xylanolyticus]
MTTKTKILDEIFNSDSLGLLNVKPKCSSARNADERLLASFQEIVDFYERNNNQEPTPNPSNIAEYQLYSRLKNLRESEEKISALASVDKYNLLQSAKQELISIDDIFSDNTFDLLNTDSEGLFDFKHTPKEYERASAEFVARRKPCKDFKKYEPLFKEIQKDLACNNRKLIDFAQRNLVEGSYYVHNGVLFLLEKISITQKEHYKPDGTRVREDGRTRCIFENGTESNMLKRSVEKILYANGKVVTENIQKVNEGFIENFCAITTEDEVAGYIYVLKSKSTDNRITSIQNLYKIGYSKTEVTERIKNAEKEPTYLMAPVDYIAGWKCFNMNPQKFEQLIHNFFGNSCLEIDVFDDNGKRFTPREWFIAPIEVIEQTIELIINGKVIYYKYDAVNMTIIKR